MTTYLAVMTSLVLANFIWQAATERDWSTAAERSWYQVWAIATLWLVK